MKKMMIFLSLLISSNLYATGGFECTSKKEGILVAYGTTASVVGNPLIALTIIENGVEKSYSRDQVMGYWNMGPELKVAVSDQDYMELEYVLETKEVAPRINEGKTVGTLTNSAGQKLDVVCLY